jgi:hypothetical protein
VKSCPRRLQRVPHLRRILSRVNAAADEKTTTRAHRATEHAGEGQGRVCLLHIVVRHCRQLTISALFRILESVERLQRLRARLAGCSGDFPGGRLDDAVLQGILDAFSSDETRVPGHRRAVVVGSSTRSYRVTLPRLTVALAGVLGPVAQWGGGGNPLSLPIALAVVGALGAFAGSLEPVKRDDAEILVILDGQGLGGGLRRALPYEQLVTSFAERQAIDVSGASCRVDESLARLMLLDCVREDAGRVIVLKDIVAVTGDAA